MTRFSPVVIDAIRRRHASKPIAATATEVEQLLRYIAHLEERLGELAAWRKEWGPKLDRLWYLALSRERVSRASVRAALELPRSGKAQPKYLAGEFVEMVRGRDADDRLEAYTVLRRKHGFGSEQAVYQWLRDRRAELRKRLNDLANRIDATSQDEKRAGWSRRLEAERDRLRDLYAALTPLPNPASRVPGRARGRPRKDARRK